MREDQRRVLELPPDVPGERSFFVTGIRIGMKGADRHPSAVRVGATERPGAVHFQIELH